MLPSLTFRQLRTQNVARCEESFHPLHDWSPTDWGNAAAGEMGEACNLLKKLRRGEQIPLDEVGDEFADAVIYLDLAAARLGLSLDAAIVRKFNRTSDKIGSERRLTPA